MLPHAKRTPWIPSKYAEGERRYGRYALSNTFGECVVAKANEADCGAQTQKSKHVRKGGSFNCNKRVGVRVGLAPHPNE